MENWDSILGHKSLRCGGKKGGLISKKEKWVVNLPIGLTLGKVVFHGNSVFAYSDDHTIHSIDMNSGATNWSASLPDKDVPVIHMHANDISLIVEFFVFNSGNGELVADLRGSVGDMSLQSGMATEISANFLYKVVDPKNEPGKILRFNLKNREATILETGVLNLLMPDSESILGWKDDKGRLALTRYYLEDSSVEIVNKDVDVGKMLASETQLFLINERQVLLLDLSTCQIIWEKDTNEIIDPIEIQMAVRCHIAISEEIICIKHVDNIIAISRISGNTVWSKQIPQLGDICILGDLIYSYHDPGIVVALDQNTGEEIWNHEGPAQWNSVKAQGDMVFYISPSGLIACYQWDESNPYISPAKVA